MDKTTRKIKSHTIWTDANGYSEKAAVDDTRPKNVQTKTTWTRQPDDKMFQNENRHDHGR